MSLASKGYALYLGIGFVWVGVAFEVVGVIALYLGLGSFSCCVAAGSRCLLSGCDGVFFVAVVIGAVKDPASLK
ncbi:hypothetical protein Acr_00g0078190 [Actinidia rufa]|uniref:Transmembrane protein n=1 Tax=Actinidia rufa TaxID=165716 RepID=A0A7J0DTG2_9ERIC|nr:hypothetical protein Acr_00g0078190 [Actinidia rufa]